MEKSAEDSTYRHAFFGKTSKTDGGTFGVWTQPLAQTRFDLVFFLLGVALSGPPFS